MLPEKPTPTDIAVIIPTFNRVEKLLNCLTSIYAQENVRLFPIVINDGSKDGTTKVVRQRFPQVTVLEGSGNLWWAGAINLGFQAGLKAGFDYYLIINDDNELGDGAVASLLASSQANSNAVIGSIVVYRHTNEVSDAGVIMRWNYKGPHKLDHWHKYDNQYRGLLKVDVPGGQGVLIPRQVLETIGLFDAASFPQYFADNDFFLRARAKGFDILLDTRSIVWNIPNSIVQPSLGLKGTWLDIWRGYTWKGSANNVVYTSRFFLRHCRPRYLLPYSLLRRLLSFPIGYIRIVRGKLQD